MELLYEKEYEVNELRKKYMDILQERGGFHTWVRINARF